MVISAKLYVLKASNQELGASTFNWLLFQGLAATRGYGTQELNSRLTVVADIIAILYNNNCFATQPNGKR
jgi:hypothetical protein